MSARTKARKRALDTIFESEMRGLSLDGTLAERIALNEPPVNDYTSTLVRGVAEHRTRIDGLLRAYSEGWPLDRMPAVDRNVLRLGVFELLYVDDVPDGVVVSEALGLVRDLSTDESPAFVNGILGALVRDKDNLRDEVVAPHDEFRDKFTDEFRDQPTDRLGNRLSPGSDRGPRGYSS